MDLKSLCDHAVSLHQAGDLAGAERLYQQIIAAEPGNVTACHFLGLIRLHQGRNQEALGLIEAALTHNRGDAEMLSDCGIALRALGRLEEALLRYDQAIAIRPDYAEAFYNRGVTLAELHRFREALESYDQALAIAPGLVLALNNRGNVLRHLQQPLEALVSYDAALAIQPTYVDALNNRGIILQDLGRADEALASFDRSLALTPQNPAALYNRANVLRDLKRLEEAFHDYVAALTLDPAHPHARDGAAAVALNLCDWPRTAKIAQMIHAQAARGKSIVTPFTLLGYSGDAALQRQCAEDYVARMTPSPPLWNGTIYRHDRIRLAYLSADLRRHATADLMAELFERHDRDRFEVHAISFSPDDGSAMRARLHKAFDHFHDVSAQGDQRVAELLRALEIDIAVDLNGHTHGSRPQILLRRPAPVQVNYLGYPGTMGAAFIDYVIADKIVLPFDQQPFFREKIVHLPDCYQPNDSLRAIAPEPPSRRDAGLPEQGVVFCCFNNSWKITAVVFDVWMQLLAKTPGSVLWLIEDSKQANAHLQSAAASRGIDPGRLVFAARIETADHLARHRLADLFLDTLPVNAHTTASDALWAGLPLITCLGSSFSGRVAASLLTAIGLPELVTNSMEAYQALAMKLAGDPALLSGLRQKLAADRADAPLFDILRLRQKIEAAYVKMWEIAQRGETPQSFGVS